jgi:hypothetical protein
MNTQLLVRHPAPYPTESVFGYVLRLSEENGYKSPWGLFHLAKMTQSESSKHGFTFEKLAVIANCTTSKLDNILYAASGELGRSRNLDKAFLLPGAGAAHRHFCPQCVVEKGFIEAHWSLPLMVGCPVHQCLAVSSCPKCGEPLSWYRQGLLTCKFKCDKDLRDCDQPPITESEANLLDVIRRKVLGYAASEENPLNFPLNDLMAMDLQTLLRAIKTIAKHRMVTDKCQPTGDQRRIIDDAASVLGDWPRNFVELLREFGAAMRVDGKKKIVAECKELYRALFSNYINAPRKESDFLLSVLVEYAVNEWEYSDAFHLERFRDRLPTGLLSAAQFAEKVRVGRQAVVSSPTTVAVVSMGAASEPAQALLPTEHGDEIPVRDSGKPVTDTDAAKLLGLPQDLLQPLIDGGIFKAKRQRSGTRGFHQGDIDAFRRMILALAPPAPSSVFTVDSCISLDAALTWRWDSIGTKVQLLQALLEKRLGIVDNIDGTMAGLQLERAAYLEFVANARDRASGDTLSAKESGKYLGCDRGIIPVLVRLGVLLGSESPASLRIEKGSLEDFKTNYIFLAVLARTLHTNTEGLVSHCNRIGIRVIWPRTGNKTAVQPFIHRKDLTLKAAVGNKRWYQQARSRRRASYSHHGVTGPMR